MKFIQNLEYFSIFTYIPVTYFKNQQEVFHFPELKLSSRLVKTMLSQISQNDLDVQIVYTEELLCLGIIKTSGRKGSVVLGPIASLPCDYERAQHILRKYGFPSTQTQDLLNYISNTPKYTLQRFANLLVYANYIFNRKTIDISELEFDDYMASRENEDVPHLQNDSFDDQIFHNTEQFERQLFNAVQYGKIDLLNSLLNQKAAPSYGGISASDQLRNYKNLTMCSITMASRVAIRGGIDYETSMRYADTAMQKAEMANDLDQLRHLNHNMLRSFTRLVAAQKIGNPNSYVANKVHHYIERHISERIHVKQIADELGFNGSYLSSQFKKDTGLNLHDFINIKKTDHAKMLLITTELPIIEIASALAFSSQSHFQTVFKKHCGVTPNNFRKSTTDTIPGVST